MPLPRQRGLQHAAVFAGRDLPERRRRSCRSAGSTRRRASRASRSTRRSTSRRAPSRRAGTSPPGSASRARPSARSRSSTATSGPRPTRARSSRRSASSSTRSPSGSASFSCSAASSTLLHGWEGEPARPAPDARAEWWIIVDFLRQHRPAAAHAHLAEDDQLPLLERRRRGAGPPRRGSRAAASPSESDETGPSSAGAPSRSSASPTRRSGSPREHLSGEEIRSCIEKWIKDDMAGFLLRAAENQGTSTADLAQALGRFHDSHIDDRQLSRTIQVELRVSLAPPLPHGRPRRSSTSRRTTSTPADFFELARHVICAAEEPRPRRRQERGPLPRHADREEVDGVRRRARRRSASRRRGT